ncbi:hypothetical protein [Paenibacillus gorillae]|uniref:hypothetical protein n=1 Tax=Paenibacillus gorillae TaxID=1243662 RepID=UPI0004AF7C05|nr:hypothetical protein [Paenibacillus gorillae]
MEKHLRVNTSIFDMISTTAESIDAYDEIKVNCSICLTTSKSRQLLARGTFGVNTEQLIDVGDDENVKVTTFNGLKVLNSQVTAPKDPTIVIANGGLIIEDSDKKTLDQFKYIFVNGFVFHPKSLDTSNFMVNGVMLSYPDRAILMFQALELTDVLLKAAPQGSIYSVQGIPSKKNKLGNGLIGTFKEIGIIATEPLDFELLKSKNIRFNTSWVTVSEDNAEQLLPFVEGYVGMTIIPSNFKIMRGGKLDRLSVRRFGTRIYVDGDLQIDADAADTLAAVEQLQVTGRVTVADSLADDFFAKCQQYGDVTVYQGEWIEHTGSEMLLNSEMLEGLAGGATLYLEEADVELAADTPVQLLADKLHGIILKNSSLTLGLNQQKVLLKKIENYDSDLIIREQVQPVDLEQEPQPETRSEPEPETKTYVETRINTSYYKL